MIESNFQKSIKKELKTRFPGCYVLKNDPTMVQGIPDLTILYKDKWAMLEVKKSEKAPHQPNQDIHVKQLNDMSFAAFIFPENKESIFNDLERLFGFEKKVQE